MKIKRQFVIGCCSILLVICFAVAQTWAGEISFDLTIPYVSYTTGNIPTSGLEYASGTISVSGDTATFNVSLNTGLDSPNAGGDWSHATITGFYFNSSVALTPADFSGLPSGWAVQGDGTPNKIKADSSPYYFQWYVSDAPTSPVQPLEFTVTNSDITSATDFEQVSNGGGMFAVYANFQWNNDQNERHGIFTTPPAPEPSTLLLISSGLVGLAAYRKRFKKA